MILFPVSYFLNSGTKYTIFIFQHPSFLEVKLNSNNAHVSNHKVSSSHYLVKNAQFSPQTTKKKLLTAFHSEEKIISFISFCICIVIFFFIIKEHSITTTTTTMHDYFKVPVNQKVLFSYNFLHYESKKE